jgi:hypothetical protein
MGSHMQSRGFEFTQKMYSKTTVILATLLCILCFLVFSTSITVKVLNVWRSSSYFSVGITLIGQWTGRSSKVEERQGIKGGRNSQRPMKIGLSSLINTNTQVIWLQLLEKYALNFLNLKEHLFVQHVINTIFFVTDLALLSCYIRVIKISLTHYETLIIITECWSIVTSQAPRWETYDNTGRRWIVCYKEISINDWQVFATWSQTRLLH